MIRFVIGALCLASQMGALASTAGNASFEAITIEGRIYDRAGVPKPILKAAENEVAEVFRRAGVNLRWLDCTTAHGQIPNASCDGASSPLQLSLNILGSQQSPSNPIECGHALYVSAGSFADYAVIYYARVARSTERNVALRPVLLSNVMAHELGHLLLGPSSHSDRGVMAANLPANIPMTLGFTAVQLDRIRKAAVARAEVIQAAK